jgi:hypothetical protein
MIFSLLTYILSDQLHYALCFSNVSCPVSRTPASIQLANFHWSHKFPPQKGPTVFKARIYLSYSVHSNYLYYYY